ncbi:MAG: DedA family protein [archaeon]
MVFVEGLLGMSREFFGFWGYAVVFIAIFLESFPFLGAFVPGGIIALFLCGFLTKLGYFVLWEIVLVAVIASISIDMVGYFFGRSRCVGFLCKRSRIFLVKQHTIERIGRIVKKNAGKSLIFGKMNPVTRSITPFIIGNERIGFHKFIFYSILSSVLWVVFFVSIGYLFGNSLEFVRHAERLIVWLMVVFLGGFYVYYIGNLFLKFFGNKGNMEDGVYCKR